MARHCAERSSRSFNLERIPDGGARLYVSSDKVSAPSLKSQSMTSPENLTSVLDEIMCLFLLWV